jgi:hypothetical protein
MSLAGTAILLVLAASGPKAELRALRQMSFLKTGSCDVEVAFRLVVSHRGREDYYCPRVEWVWEDGTTSEEESDCPPFAEASADDERQVWTRRRAFQGSGRYVVSVRLFKADRLISTLEAEAVVIGWSGFPPEKREKNGCSPARPGPIPSPSLVPPGPVGVDRGPPN